MRWFTDLFPFVPPQVLALAYALVILWILVRWGDVIFISYALWLFWHQHAVDAVCYVLVAFFFGAMKAGYMYAARCQGYRGPWV
jgi:hypothetical protein